VALKRLDRVGPVVITIAGDDDGSLQSLREKQKILKAIDGLSGKVRLTGFLTHEELLVEAYRHHVFLSPSVVSADGDIEGGAPVTIIEMAATGMMVVSTRHCDIPYVIKDGETGFLANERDVDGLVEHLHWLNDNPESWEKVAIAARTHIERDFNARDQGMRLAAVYKSLSR
jgi:colanic acid/amylovoran biosynthesis glycosyltransferase